METKVRYLVDTNVWLERLLDQEISNIQKYKLDFDDSYQFSIAQKYELTIVTFDKDFDVKGIKKNTPDEIIEKDRTL